jgi:hypothetical protein
VDANTPELSFLDRFVLPFASGTTWYVLVALLLSAAAWAWRRADASQPMLRRTRALIAFGVVAVGLTHLGGSQATFLRYHLPGAVGAVALALAVLRVVSDGRRPRLALSLALLFGLLSVRQVRMDVEWHTRLTDEHRALRAAAAAAIRGDGGSAESVVLYGGRFPDPAFALRLFARTDEERTAIDAAHPCSGLYDRRGRSIESPSGRAWEYLVLEDHDLASFPEPHGAVIATVGRGNSTTSTYRVVRR